MFCSLKADPGPFRRGLLAVAVAIAIAALARAEAIDPPPAKAIYTAPPTVNIQAAAIAHSVVYVTQDMGNGSTAAGTGTVIAAEDGHSLILTNAHVAQAGHAHSVTYWSDGKPYTSPAKFLEGSRVSNTGPNSIQVHGPDLAILVLEAAELRPVEIATAIPAAGEAVQLYGFGGAGLNGTVPLHKTGKTMPADGWQTMAGDPIQRTSIQTVNGDSGAGIFNDAGQLVAVHWGGGAVRLDTVHSFTVQVLERKSLFKRFKDRIAARQIAKALSGALSSFTPSSPPPVKSPAPPAPAAPITLGNCPGGVCSSPTGRGILRRR